jgi:hypothetical protein
MTANGATVAKICPAELAAVGSHFGVRNPIELNGINDLSLATSIEHIHLIGSASFSVTDLIGRSADLNFLAA